MTHTIEQLDALTRAFLARFFESEITSGSDDLKHSFFWLLGALAVPGIFIPWIMGFEWQLMAFMQGPEAVRIASRAEKTFYVGFAMVASGVLTAIAWSSLLPDRRDTLILGTFPVRPRTIVSAKLAALVGYIALVAAGMHAAGSVVWGMVLGDAVSPLFSLRGMVAHFVASSAASMSVCLGVAAVQGLALASVGPRLFRRLSPLLQVIVVATSILCLATLPTFNSTIVRTLNDPAGPTSWILATPPVWFLGLYEWLLGTSDPLLLSLARRAGLALAVVLAGTIVSYPLAYRRLMISVVESVNERGNVLARALRRLVVAVAGRQPAPQAAAEFFTATLGRVDRQRFVLAMAAGFVMAWSLPALRSFVPSNQPTPSLLGLPIAMMMFLVAGLRVAASLPADVRAAWVFEVHDVSRRHARQAVERTLFVLGVAPPLLIFTPVLWYLWGGEIAVIHALVILGLGVTLIELLIWQCEAMPCGQRWAPVRGDLGRRWPIYFALFLLVVVGVPQLEMVLLPHRTAAISFSCLLLATAALMRHRSATHAIVPSYDEVDPVAGVLRLN